VLRRSGKFFAGSGKNPQQHGFEFGLWTRKIVQVLVLQSFGQRLSLASIGATLTRLGLTAQKPLQRAYQRDPQAIENWQRVAYPAIAAQARKEDCDVFFWD
jgi:transposase